MASFFGACLLSVRNGAIRASCSISECQCNEISTTADVKQLTSSWCERGLDSDATFTHFAS